jgi:hypothetical protein
MKFASLKLNDWRQFSTIDIDFHERMTIVTGANGSGKSTILRLLAAHFGWQNQLLSTPREGKGGVFQYFTGAQKKLLRRVLSQQVRPGAVNQQPMDVIGTIRYSNGVSSEIGVPEQAGAIYNALLTFQQAVQGLYIPSHRQANNYQPVAAIPTNAIDANYAYQMYWQALMHRYNNANGNIPSPFYRMKETLISLATFGPGNEFVRRNERSANLFERFTQILRELLPPSLGFQAISVRIPDVVLVTKTGEFILDSASGGLMSIIDLAWQIFLYSNDKDEFIVALDEPENHLHPSMQRAILSRLLVAFPRAQFVIATHSPFIVSSVRESAVYALKYRDSSESEEFPGSRSIDSIRLELGIRASSASDILREVLGVPVTLPQWAEEELKQISERFSVAGLTENRIAELRGALADAGLEEYYSDALGRVIVAE